MRIQFNLKCTLVKCKYSLRSRKIYISKHICILKVVRIKVPGKKNIRAKRVSNSHQVVAYIGLHTKKNSACVRVLFNLVLEYSLDLRLL